MNALKHDFSFVHNKKFWCSSGETFNVFFLVQYHFKHKESIRFAQKFPQIYKIFGISIKISVKKIDKVFLTMSEACMYRIPQTLGVTNTTTHSVAISQ